MCARQSNTTKYSGSKKQIPKKSSNAQALRLSSQEIPERQLTIIPEVCFEIPAPGEKTHGVVYIVCPPNEIYWRIERMMRKNPQLFRSPVLGGRHKLKKCPVEKL